MNGMKKSAKNRFMGHRTGVILTTLLTGGLLTGCSQVPDAVNPVEWYNSSVRFFAGEEARKDQAQNDGQPVKQAVPDTDQQFPNLASVDQQKQRDDVRTKGLVADVEGRKYTPPIARQGDAINALNAPPAKPPVPVAMATRTGTQPAPPAMPAAPVMSNPIGSATAAPMPEMAATDSLATTGEQKDFQAQMVKRLAEIRARAAQGTDLPQYSSTDSGADIGETVVISSDGIQSGYSASGSTATRQLASTGTGQWSLAQVSPSRAVVPGGVRVATIMFENGSYKLNARDRSILASVRRIQQERGGRLRVVGHASSRTRNMDPVRHKMINFNVSASRANAIVNELIKQGLDKSSVDADAVSDSSPVYFEFMPSGEAGNRRAEIYLES